MTLTNNIDIADFRRPGLPDCHYIFVVITKTPKYDFEYETFWQRLVGRLTGQKIAYTYFREGQIVICDTDAQWASPREAAWGGKPGKHSCKVEKFSDLQEAIECAEAVINEEYVL